MGDIDCDDFGIDSAMRRARRIRWQNSRTVPYVAHDSDDCAPGLETPGDPRFPQLLALAKIQAGPNAMLVRWATMDLRAGFERDQDRPSPGDDLTRPAFDALDRE